MKSSSLSFASPAGHFNEALPLGNGRLGAMFYGGILSEIIHLNEDSLWSGTGPASVAPKAKAALPEIRRLLFAKQLKEAHDLAIRTLPGSFTQAYLPVGDLTLELISQTGQITLYERELDLNRAIGLTTFVSDGIRHCRELFVSQPAQVVALRWFVDSAARFDVLVSLKSPLQHTVFASAEGLILSGQAPTQVDCYTPRPDSIVFGNQAGRQGMSYTTHLRLQTNGRVSIEDDRNLQISTASEVVMYLDTRTTFCSQTPEEISCKSVAKAINVGWDQLLKAHVIDHQSLYHRVELELIDANDQANHTFPLSERLQFLSQGESDPELITLLFNLGRYLLIASSRPGSQPANLQGLWNREVQPPWWSNYTLNINLQMNYWLAEVCNLSELHEPLFDYVDRLRFQGEVVARELYSCRGWCVHHQSDIWASANPAGFLADHPNDGASRYALWPMGAAWLCRHFWEHYLFTGDDLFLENRVWPNLKGAALFFLDFLLPHPDGYLTTAPSTSPENSFRLDDGFRAAIATGSAMDISLIRELFLNCLAAASNLKLKDVELLSRIQDALSRLPPLQISSSGRIQEWDDDYLEWEPHHRHISHLYGLYPGAEISPERTPDLAEAAKRSLRVRGDDGTGWSLAWKINLWARLWDSDKANQLIRKFFNPVPAEKIDLDFPGGLYPNLLCAHPPFDIDGNFGFTAGVAEMLLQSCLSIDPPDTFEIHLLPSLPQDWNKGRIKGLCARGAIWADLSWQDGNLQAVYLKSILTRSISLRYKSLRAQFTLVAGEIMEFSGDLKRV